MKIETKYNIGDEVWMNDNNEPEKCKIKRVIAHFGELSNHCWYALDNGHYLMECYIHKNKEEALKGL